MNPLITVAYHSGYGHTAKVAESVAQGLRDGGATAVVLAVDKVDEAIEGHENGWALLEASHGIVFGSPTYMAGASGPFKVFADASSKPWFERKWKDKIAGGFTNSGNPSGDKSNTLQFLYALAMQHGMVWVGFDEIPNGEGETRVNQLGSYTGVMTVSENAPPDVTPGPGDLETARRYGVRLAEATKRWNA